jgi:hypothetical protein
MPKTNDAARKRPTNFEQVPLDVVKKIAVPDAPRNDNTATDAATDARTPIKTTGRSVAGRPPGRHKR